MIEQEERPDEVTGLVSPWVAYADHLEQQVERLEKDAVRSHEDYKTQVNCIVDLQQQVAELTDRYSWICVNDSTPTEGEVVVLLNINRFVSEERSIENLLHVGCLRNSSGGYWSITGERAMIKSAFTHWMPLPLPPAIQGESE